MSPEQVLTFWFEELTTADHYKKNPELDMKIKDQFAEALGLAKMGELHNWRMSAEGRLAEIIILDQFSRNIFRDQAKAFEGDPMAVKLSLEAVSVGADQKTPIERRSYMYMPLMHSEDLEVHKQAMVLFSQPGLENSLKYEKAHMAIIERFGRYPHRNKILGRESTPEESEFLKGPGSSF